jgi:hypothetical protein
LAATLEADRQMRPEPSQLLRWERIGLALFALVVIAFGVLTEIKSSRPHHRQTDLGVYLRAAFAVRTGGDIYQVTDNNNRHYTYPPAFAVLMTPLADAPDGVSRDGLLPYPLSVALWTLFNYFLLVRITHVLATLLLPGETWGSRRWWYARTVPIYVTLLGLFHSIGFGQVNVVVVSMLVEMLRSRLTGRSLQAGCWLAAAIVLKVFPAYLLLYPLFMRDRRFGIGVALGLFVGVAVIPVAGLGFAGTEMAYRSFADRILIPGALGTDNPERLRELLPMKGEIQSFLGVIHNYLYLDTPYYPETTSRVERLTHYALAAVFTLLTLWVAWRRGLASKIDEVIFVGSLMLLMIHITPMSHPHYYSFGVVLVSGLWLHGMSCISGVRPGWRVTLPLVIWGVGNAPSFLEGDFFDFFNYHGLGLACSIMLWAVAMTRIGSQDMPVGASAGQSAMHHRRRHLAPAIPAPKA